MAYKSVYPVAQSDTYVKSTTKYDTDYWAYYATDPTKSLTGSAVSNSWASVSGSYTNQRFHIDLGSGKMVKRIYYENYQHGGAATDQGSKTFTFWGSNTASNFADLVYANNGTWVQITPAQSTFDQHIAADQTDPKYILVTNTTNYRYYAFKFADGWGSTNIMGLRRVELQILPAAGFMIFLSEAWERHKKLWTPDKRLLLPKDLGFSY